MKDKRQIKEYSSSQERETKEELLLKIKYFLKNKDELKLIGENGFKRNLKDKNEVRDRATQIMNTYISLI